MVNGFGGVFRGAKLYPPLEYVSFYFISPMFSIITLIRCETESVEFSEVIKNIMTQVKGLLLDPSALSDYSATGVTTCFTSGEISYSL